MTTKLAAATQKTAGIGNGMRTATIAAVSGSAVTLSINGGLITSGVGVIDSYTPFVGDVVAVFRQDSSWLVLGAIGTSQGPQPRATDTGTASVTLTAVNSLTVAVAFNRTFAAPPVVTTNITNATGAVSRWVSRATAISTTGFTLWVQSADSGVSTWASIPVDWTATARA